MNSLVIDVGNTLSKVAVFQSGEKKQLVTSALIPPMLELLIRDLHPKAAILSTVTKVDEQITKLIKDIPRHIVLDQNTPLPFKNKYATPESLGNDRLGNVAAAQQMYPGKNVLVIDSGTCLKFDFINSSAEYRGGAISPGLSMRYKAVHHYTGRLPLLDPIENAALIGDSTASSIHSGILNGMVAEINGIISRYESEFAGLQLILTGGDAHYFLNHLKKSIFATPDLTLKGLLTILQFNYPDDPL